MASITAKMANSIPGSILKSPLHSIMSAKYAIIEFTGRRSGRTYTTPMAYVRQGDLLLMSTDSPWWRNLAGGAPVHVVLRNKRVAGTAIAIEDPARAAQILRSLVDAIPSYSRPAGLERVDGHVSDAEIARSVREGRVSIEIRLHR